MVRREGNLVLIGYIDVDLHVIEFTESLPLNGPIPSSPVFFLRDQETNSLSLSTVEAEYITTVAFCTQLLWLKHQLCDYGISVSHIPILCDNTSDINISKIHIQHSCSKFIEIKHHFMQDCVKNGQ